LKIRSKKCSRLKEPVSDPLFVATDCDFSREIHQLLCEVTSLSDNRIEGYDFDRDAEIREKFKVEQLLFL
jgi:hypothetical protein